MYKRILVSVENSPYDEAILTHVRQLARENGRVDRADSRRRRVGRAQHRPAPLAGQRRDGGRQGVHRDDQRGARGGRPGRRCRACVGRSGGRDRRGGQAREMRSDRHGDSRPPVHRGPDSRERRQHGSPQVAGAGADGSRNGPAQGAEEVRNTRRADLQLMSSHPASGRCAHRAGGGLPQGDLRAWPRDRRGRDQRHRSTARRRAGLGERDGPPARRTGTAVIRALSWREADGERSPGRLAHFATPSRHRSVSVAGARLSLGPRARGSRAAGARGVGRAGGQDGGDDRRAGSRSARRADPSRDGMVDETEYFPSPTSARGSA